MGPSALALTCVSGYTCSMDGMDVSDALVAVRDTCGVASAVHGVPFDSQLRHLTLSQSTTSRLSAAGGLYRLCWCAMLSPNSCKDDAEFRTDFGSLQVLGPTPLKQDQTCVLAGPISGSTCALDITFGQSTWSAGQLAILETCSVPTVVPHLSATGLTSRLTSVKSGSFGTHEEFHSEPISAGGGQYSVCWCALTPGPCSQAFDYSVHVGKLTVIGPSNMHQQTCISGQPCTLEALEGLLGSDLSDDRLLIADTCGRDSGVVSSIAGGIEGQVGGMWSVLSRNARVAFLGGQYRLCWCDASVGCLRAVDFKDIGGMLLIGPSPMSGRTCISGLTCKFDGLTGHYLSSEDKLILSDTCGMASEIFQVAQITVSPEGFGASVAWGVPLKMSGGLYRLCWCPGHVESVESANCFVGEDFKVDVGALSIVGVAPLQHAKTCVSGLVCKVNGITGNYLSNDDQFLILETCGVNGAFVEGLPHAGASSHVTSSGASVTFGTHPLTAAAGQYQLCWCPGPTTRNSKSPLCGNSA